MKTGHTLEWDKMTLSAPPSLTWFASYTQNITSIVFTSPAHAIQKL